MREKVISTEELLKAAASRLNLPMVNRSTYYRIRHWCPEFVPAHVGHRFTFWYEGDVDRFVHLYGEWKKASLFPVSAPAADRSAAEPRSST